MPRSDVRTHCTRTVPMPAPAEIHCAPPDAPAADETATSATRAATDRIAAHPPRATKVPGRPLDAVMQAFREQRRLTQAQGTPAAVIAEIVARTGHGSLLADLKRPD